jgi:succinate-semialdehyde dehydrogenase/glutarate-semialdehyde dehydrogenase
MFSSISPTDGRLLATYEETSPGELRRHIETAARLQREWAEVPVAERARPMRAMAEALEGSSHALAGLIADEMGKPVAEGIAEVRKCAWVCRHYAEGAERMLADLPVPAGHLRSYVAHRPLGVVLAVMPWNFPFWQVYRFLAPALMAGNGAVLKHASNVSGCALAIDELAVRAGFPDGVFRSLLLPSARVEEALSHPAVAAATLTGSEPAGRAVAAAAGALGKKTVLELGGSDPYLVLADADVEAAARTCAASRLINGGQSCIAAKRFIVERRVHDDFVERMSHHLAQAVMGDPHDETTTLGPLARPDLRDRLHRQVTASVAAGAGLVMGGEIPEGPGAFYPPTLLVGAAAGMPVCEEETFGPVAAVIEARDLDEAVRIANDSRFGLGAAVFTTDVERGERVARDRLEAGTCVVNGLVASDPRLPFGGIKASGYGRELGEVGIREFLNLKTVIVE